jgi:hypothetical protein
LRLEDKRERLTIDRRFVAEKDKPEAKEAAAKTVVQESGSRIDKKKITYDANRKPAKEMSDDGGEFSFGDMLRFLLIAAIIIALGFLLLSQAAQLSKSWEK